MIICTRCKAENRDGSKFCANCGNDLTVNVDAPANEDLKNLAEALNQQAVRTEKQPLNLNKAISEIPKKIGNKIKGIGNKIVGVFKKIGKKRLIIWSCSIVAVILCALLTVSYIIPFAPHYFNGNTAFNDADYKTAIEEYTLANGFLNAKSKLNDSHYLYAEELLGDKRYYEAATHYDATVNYDDVNEKLVQCGTGLLEQKKYSKSLEVLAKVKNDEVATLKTYVTGMNNLDTGSYEEAKKNFNSVGDYKDAKEMINACDLMIAEDYCKKGKFTEAKNIYTKLPDGFSYNGISASGRIALLNGSQTLINAMGKWSASDNYIESRNIYRRTGSWDNWYYGHDNVLSDQDLEVSCTLNSNNTFYITGTVSFYKFDDYSSLSEYCKAEKTTKSFSIDNVTSIPSSYKIDSYTTLNFSGGVFSIKYSERDDYSSYFYNMYNSSVTYGQRG